MNRLELPTARVFLIDRSAFVCDRLKALLTGIASVVGYACTPDEAIAGVIRHRPDIVIVDLAVAELDGFRLLNHLRRSSHAMVMIVLAENMENAFRTHCLRLGAHYFLDKTHEFESVPEIISNRHRDDFRKSPMAPLMAEEKTA